MSNLKEELEDIKTLLNSKTQKPLAYSTLLQHLQRYSALHAPSSTQLLAESSHLVLSSILIDILDHSEEIAAQALKCLGFMIYHPTVLASITGDYAKIIVNTLVEVILTTKIKCVCNLGVWCISIQQFNEMILDTNFDLLLRAIVHALDNPFGSLSITFEAMQAVTKLANSLSERMREMSNIWGPPIYRRLVSSDKRERDISERCLLNNKSIIFPPLSTLSKVVIMDMKKKLICELKDLFNNGMKIQALQAWGWFIRLLGSYIIKHKTLVNQMLKIPEHTFSHLDSQLQIATLVAWEGFIDAIIDPPFQNEIDKFSKRLKLIVTPLIGIISSKCDMSVHESAMNTWSYLLHKLDTFVVCESLVKIVWEPIFEALFKVGPTNLSLWNFCFDLLNTFILARTQSSPTIITRYPIKWSTWDLSQLHFFIRIIHSLINQSSDISITHALTLFKSLLKIIQIVLKYEEITLCLNTILSFLNMCENENENENDVFLSTSISLLEAVIEDIDPSILKSNLYKVETINNNNMVPPIVYITNLYLNQINRSISKSSEYHSILLKMQTQIKSLLQTYDPVEILQVFINLLYANKGSSCLKIWLALSECVENSNYSVKLSVLEYPFAVYSTCQIQLEELNHVIKTWNLLFTSDNSNYKRFFQDIPLIIYKYSNNPSLDFIALYGNTLVHMLQHLTSCLASKESENNNEGNINNSLEFFARFTKVYLEKKENTDGRLIDISRIFSALIHLVESIKFKDDIIVFIKIMSIPLLEWLSYTEAEDNKNVSHQFGRLWSEILFTLQRSQPPIHFNSSFLKFQEQLLKTTLDHPNPTIAGPTINFWNSTYDQEMNLKYPQTLVPVLEKLSINGRLNLHHSQIVQSSSSRMKKCLSLKRKRNDELTEHQKEVRRSQQGKGRDCNGHGPGIHTYTTLDFSQGNQESQDSQDIIIRDANSILELLKKVA